MESKRLIQARCSHGKFRRGVRNVQQTSIPLRPVAMGSNSPSKGPSDTIASHESDQFVQNSSKEGDKMVVSVGIGCMRLSVDFVPSMRHAASHSL
ncbi:hypothetical protein BC830DRAFT_1100541 [Chytriomyces sp. MP71]|nr:hypothetical protein BC830DRAFT_1100541 [Chytriomyces sp. MP71]